jgi:hypothetical protein
VESGWLEIGSDHNFGPDVSLRRSDIATLAALDALADEDGMVEEGYTSDAEADAIVAEAEANPPSPDEIARVRDGVMAKLEASGHFNQQPPAPSPAPARCECGHSATAHGVALNLSCDCCECSEYEPSTPAPAPAPAPETREWWLVLSNHDLRPLCVYPTQERARRAALELHGSGCDAQSLPVVPRASLDATEAARRTDVATIQATADALYGDNNRPPAWQSGMPGAVGAMREERDQFQKAYDAAERHNTILRENVERHGDTIRTIRAQLREATERSELAREALREMGEFRDWYCAEMQTVEDAKAATGMSLWLSLRHALEERATLRAQLAAATGPVSRETMTEVAVAVARQMKPPHDPYDFKGIARAAITALGRSVEGVKRVEAWLMQQPLTHYITRNYDGHYEATAAGRVVPNTEAQSPTLAALGHALPDDTAQEER